MLRYRCSGTGCSACATPIHEGGKCDLSRPRNEVPSALCSSRLEFIGISRSAADLDTMASSGAGQPSSWRAMRV